jgi:predicted nuclease of predicted toxin-antitoxin system
VNAIKLLADENIAAPMVAALRDAGHDVLYIVEHAPGVADDEVLDLAREESRVILTEDKDFGDLVVRLKKGVSGVILVRLPSGPWKVRYDRLAEVLDIYKEEFHDRYVVVETDRVRSRPIVPS